MARKDEIFIKRKDGTVALKQLAIDNDIGYVTLFYRHRKLSIGVGATPTAEEVLATPRQGRPPLNE